MAKKSKTRAPVAPATSDKPVVVIKQKKRVSSKLALTLPLSRARKLASDLHQAAGLRLWAEAIEAAAPEVREELIQLQDAICDAGDLLKQAKSNNPKHLALFMVACCERDGRPATPPQFVTAASEDEAVAIWKAAFKGQFGRRKPRAQRVPERGEEVGLHV
ncbi:hypothetical protein CCR94_23285 [Rhodoblastus sphagnicola]|uniref:Uncharacterized protein n=1 Tax=Rhodoblastus sphagnicola TaxID=333368 RepID=A0A2S6MUC7_9HYPH|nr:hypothetical protein [Rhodoblastus sphagnicola]MBB4197040.1 hypothetical protein [Rhodoblastus sphagnicola]PPQ25959.1 hypothetical protein CCR94_23285 [Rhodoblastus sphagnicola]